MRALLIHALGFISCISCQKPSHSQGGSNTVSSSSPLDRTDSVILEIRGTTLDPKNPMGPSVRVPSALLDIGEEDRLGLVIPLKNLLQKVPNSTNHFLPIMKSLDIKMWFNADQTPIQLQNLSISLTGSLAHSLKIAVVGLELETTLNPSKPIHRAIQIAIPEILLKKTTAKILHSDQVLLDSKPLRNAYTSYVLALLPKNLDSRLEGLVLPSLSSEDSEEKGNLEVSIPSLKTGFIRQSFDVQRSEDSPLAIKLGNTSAAGSHFMEIQGFGLCDDKEIGSVLVENKPDGSAHFLGFLALSTSSNNTFKGGITCASGNSSEEYYSLVVRTNLGLWKTLQKEKN